MALDRQSIEKKDFPIGRQGYDPDAVDAHLSWVADQVEELMRSARRRSETLASASSDQVRAIVDAAERSAAEIQLRAEEEAREIKAEASSEAQGTREQATAQAHEYVGRLSESTAVMLQRLDAMESELSALIEALRAGGGRMHADLKLVESNLGEVREAVPARPRFEPEPGVQAAPSVDEERDLRKEPARAEPEADSGADREPSAEPAPGPASVSTPAAEAPPASDDSEGARLIALNMALNGTPREETDRYLAENFKLADRHALLEDVYASVEA